MKEPSLEKLEVMRKSILLEVGEKLELETKKTMRKEKIVRIIVEHMIDEQIFEPEMLERIPGEPTKLSAEQIELERYKIQTRLELEKAKLEQEVRLREIRLAEMARQPGHSDFDLTKLKQVKMVPKFIESNVDEYFHHFENTAVNLGWPKEKWALLFLQTALVGKAQKAFTTLSSEECMNYDIVKGTILQSFELVPEAYRQKFRAYRKNENQSFKEFIAEKERLMNKWFDAKRVENDAEKIKQLVLLEEILNGLPEEMRIYLNERKIDTGSELAVIADEYTITRKRGRNKPNITSRVNRPAEPTMKRDSWTSGRTTPTKKINPVTCYKCGQVGHIAIKCRLGHGPETKTTGEAKPHGGVSSSQESEIYQPYVRKGKIIDEEGNSTPVIILIFEGHRGCPVLHSGKESNLQSNDRLHIKGIGGKAMKVPLKKIKLITGRVKKKMIVGVVKTHPMREIDILLGNEAKIELNQMDEGNREEETSKAVHSYNLRSKKQTMGEEKIPLLNKSRQALKNAQRRDDSLKELYKQVGKTNGRKTRSTVLHGRWNIDEELQ